VWCFDSSIDPMMAADESVDDAKASPLESPADAGSDQECRDTAGSCEKEKTDQLMSKQAEQSLMLEPAIEVFAGDIASPDDVVAVPNESLTQDRSPTPTHVSTGLWCFVSSIEPVPAGDESVHGTKVSPLESPADVSSNQECHNEAGAGEKAQSDQLTNGQEEQSLTLEPVVGSITGDIASPHDVVDVPNESLTQDRSPTPVSTGLWCFVSSIESVRAADESVDDRKAEYVGICEYCSRVLRQSGCT
jgi:hypothetical protein